MAMKRILRFPSISVIQSAKQKLVYPVIDQPRVIRIVKLFPGSSSQPIACELQHVSLDGDVPEYYALSYCWGVKNQNTAITCNGQRLDITKRLHEALVRFRRKDEAILLWVDQLSIDQKNLQERSSQVQLMRDIYERAHEVTVWLGSEADGSKGIFPMVRKHLPNIEKRKNPKKSKSTQELAQGSAYEAQSSGVELKLEKKEAKALMAFLIRPWFSRTWILQEISVPRKVSVVCGMETMEFRLLGEFISLVFHSDMCGPLLFELDPRGPLSEHFVGRFDFLFALKPLAESTQEVGFGDLIQQARYFEATDPRDKAYALLGCANPTGIVPDYAKSVEDVFLEVGTYLLFGKGRRRPEPNFFHLLGYAQGVDGKLNISSWVPDWSVYSKRTISYFREWAGYKAGGKDHRPKATLLENKKLSVSGKIVDQIQYVSSVAPSDIFSSGVKNFQHGLRAAFYASLFPLAFWVQETRCIAQSCQRYVSVEDAYWRTLLANQCEGGNGEMKQATEDFVTYFWQFLQVMNILAPGGLASMAPALSIAWAAQPYGDGCMKFLSNLALTALERRIAATLGGYIGLCPSSAKPGDLVCAFEGAAVPWVVRRAEGGGDVEYKLVGECYVHGFMEGEAMETEYLPMQDIVIT